MVLVLALVLSCPGVAKLFLGTLTLAALTLAALTLATLTLAALTWQQLRYPCPAVTKLCLCFSQYTILMIRPWPLHQTWVKMVEPTLTTLGTKRVKGVRG